MCIRHRGPDWSGVHVWKDRVLAHERLAIVDVEHGAQPLRNETSDVWLAVNGEIYNHKQLRGSLKQPATFLTESDCECILHLYEENKEDPSVFLNQLNGIFGFVLSDERNGRFIAARDHMGIIPLYSGRDADGSIWFASEMKALSDICVTFEDFPPGHYYDSQKGAYVQWYKPKWHDETLMSQNALDLTALREGLISAVKRQLMTDVPYGVLLSGGLDSSLIASIASRICQSRVETDGAAPAWWPRLHSFSVGLKESPDLKAARVVADALKTVHHEFHFTVDEGINAIHDVIYHLETYDVTTIRAATPMYLMSRKIKCLGVKMVLSGEGADEMFGGYLFFHKCPSKEEHQKECVRKLKGLYKFDCLRANKATAAWGVEARVPFLDKEFLDYVMGEINPADKLCGRAAGGRIEKWCLREAFKGFLPDAILWRQKEQFCLSSSTLVAMADGTSLRADQLVVDDLLVGQDGALVRVIKLDRGLTDVMWHIDLGDCSYYVTDQHRITLDWRCGPSIFIHKNRTLMVNYWDRDTLSICQRELASCHITGQEVDLQLDRLKKDPDSASWTDKQVVVADTDDEIRAIGWKLWSEHADRAKALRCGDLIDITPSTLLSKWDCIVAGTQTFAVARFTDLTARIEKAPQLIWRCTACAHPSRIGEASCSNCTKPRPIDIGSPTSASMERASSDGAMSTSSAGVGETHAVAIQQVVSLATQLDEGAVVQQFTIVAQPDKTYRPVVPGDRVRVVYMLHNPLHETETDFNADGAKALTFSQLEQVWDRLRIPLGDDGGVVITELNPIVTPAKKLQSHQGQYDELCDANMTEAVLKGLKARVIIAFGGPCSQRWRNASRLPGVTNVRTGYTTIGVEYTKFDFADGGASSTREVTVWHSTHPCVVSRVDDVVMAVAAAHNKRLDQDDLTGAVNLNLRKMTRPPTRIEKKGQEYVAVEVDGNKRFALASGVLTHNSDGVGYSWIDSLRAHAEKKVSDQEFQNAKFRFPHNTPQTKEAYYFRAVFEGHFPQPSAQSQNTQQQQHQVSCVPGGPSIACSTPAALLWDASFASFADCSGRSVAGVHDAAYDASRREQAKLTGEAINEETLAKVQDIVLPGQSPAPAN